MKSGGRAAFRAEIGLNSDALQHFSNDVAYWLLYLESTD
jgi:hypothetical protein